MKRKDKEMDGEKEKTQGFLVQFKGQRKNGNTIFP